MEYYDTNQTDSRITIYYKNYTISLYKQQHVSLHSLETAKMENLFQWLKGQLAPCKRGITAIAASAH